jgi:hypothetical protein
MATGKLKRALTQTTALIGVALLAAHSPAVAANITISTPTNVTQALGTGDSLTVTSAGTISGVSPAVSVLHATATSVE